MFDTRYLFFARIIISKRLQKNDCEQAQNGVYLNANMHLEQFMISWISWLFNSYISWVF